MNSLLKLTVAALSVITLQACESIDDDAEDPINANGVWVSECHYDTHYDEYFLEDYRFSGYTVSTTFESFDNHLCAGDPIDVISASGDFWVSTSYLDEGRSHIRDIDIDFYSEGEYIHVKDVIYVNGDYLYFGERFHNNERPESLDIRKPFRRR